MQILLCSVWGGPPFPPRSKLAHWQDILPGVQEAVGPPQMVSGTMSTAKGRKAWAPPPANTQPEWHSGEGPPWPQRALTPATSPERQHRGPREEGGTILTVSTPTLVLGAKRLAPGPPASPWEHAGSESCCAFLSSPRSPLPQGSCICVCHSSHCSRRNPPPLSSAIPHQAVAGSPILPSRYCFCLLRLRFPH